MPRLVREFAEAMTNKLPWRSHFDEIGLMDDPPKQRWGLWQWGVVMAAVGLSCMLAAAMVPFTTKSMSQMRGVNNCRQIIVSLKLYAKDNGSAYPDAGPAAVSAKSANQIFRRLFEEEIVMDERIFGCPPQSVFVPDGDIGMKPNFAQALAPGECHWMLLKSQTDTSAGDAPVVVENAVNGSWPPRWDVSAQSGSKRGRVWKGNRIIVGRNDGSVAVEKLRTDGTVDWRRMYNSGYGKSWIDTLAPEQIGNLAYWDIEEK